MAHEPPARNPDGRAGDSGCAGSAASHRPGRGLQSRV